MTDAEQSLKLARAKREFASFIRREATNAFERADQEWLISHAARLESEATMLERRYLN